MDVKYSVTSAGELVIADGRGVRWRGRPDDYPAERVVPVPEALDAIVLLEYATEGAPPQFANILRIDPDGRIAWRAAPPRPEDVGSDDADFLAGGGEDAWVAARWEKRRGLSANSFSCFYCRLDPATGRITSATFTK
jgi:hypothetical protein